MGEIQMITMPLDQEGLTEQSRFYHNHQRRMNYQELQEERYAIKSGTVESGIKPFKVRLTSPGMRWARDGANRILAIRGAVMAQGFDQVWAAAKVAATSGEIHPYSRYWLKKSL